jgi:uncharacterized protein with PQ loop repeat
MELELLAFIASMIGVTSCVPQIIKIIKKQDTDAISYTKYIMSAVAGILWVTYGFQAPLYSIVFWNSISTTLSLTVVILKLKNDIKVKSDIKYYKTPV